MQPPDSRKRDGENDEVGDDVHDRGEVEDCEAVEADGDLGGDKERGGDACKGDEDGLRDAPEGEEGKEVEADEAGATAAGVEDAAVLEEEGHLGDDLGEVVDEHGGEEALERVRRWCKWGKMFKGSTLSWDMLSSWETTQT
jgi:hypothetical protein